MKHPTCETCPYWDTSTSLDSEIDTGSCKVRPPTAGPARDNHMGVWPFTEINDWCGEHPQMSVWMVTWMAQQSRDDDGNGSPDR